MSQFPNGWGKDEKGQEKTYIGKDISPPGIEGFLLGDDYLFNEDAPYKYSFSFNFQNLAVPKGIYETGDTGVSSPH